MLELLIKPLESPINQWIIGAIFVLAIIDIIFKKDLKSQIVSLGVLGTFIGIFIGLQNFNPDDMKNSINGILLGLKTAFFTSIIGMGTALILATIQKIFYKNMDNSSSQEALLEEISKKLNNLEKLDKTQDTDKIIGELERLRTIQTDTRDETQKIPIAIDKFQNKSNEQMNSLVKILDENFKKMNISLEKAIEQLSKGATEEIIKALETVIQEFNQELQSSFGDNFVKLNEAVVNLLIWQENYKNHIEHIDEHLNISKSSIEKSEESLTIISSKNEEVLNIYRQLETMIKVYYHQTEELNRHLKTYSHLSESAESMFEVISNNISKTKEDFTTLTKSILENNTEQKDSAIKNNDSIKASYTNLTKHIKEENNSQIEFNKEIINETKEDFKSLAKSILKNNTEQKDSAINNNDSIKASYTNLTKYIKEENDKNKDELALISTHFKTLGEQIPKALEVSLNELNRGLTSLTQEFQKNYKEIMDKYKDGLNNERR